jgi:hypothetical protein
MILGEPTSSQQFDKLSIPQRAFYFQILLPAPSYAFKQALSSHYLAYLDSHVSLNVLSEQKVHEIMKYIIENTEIND